MTQVTVIIHGRIAQQQQLQAEFEHQFGYVVQWRSTKYAGHATELAAQAAAEGCTHLIAIGGDGTIHEVANGLLRSKHPEVAIGILPRGSGNDFVRTLKSPNTILELVAAIKNNQYQYIDVGQCSFVDINGLPNQRYLINIADIGIGGIIAEKMSRSNRWAGAFLTYQYHIISSLLRYKKQRIDIKADTFDLQTPIMSAVIANGKYFGKALGIAPDATPNSGHFQAIVLGNISLLDYIRHLTDLRACRRITHPEVSYHNTKDITLSHINKPLPIDIDGEFVGYTPLRIQVLPQALRFLSYGV